MSTSIKRDKIYYGGGSATKKPFQRRNKRLLDLTVMEKHENNNLRTFIRRAKKHGTQFAINSYFKESESSTVDEF
jgi:hypothetical protein